MVQLRNLVLLFPVGVFGCSARYNGLLCSANLWFRQYNISVIISLYMLDAHPPRFLQCSQLYCAIYDASSNRGLIQNIFLDTSNIGKFLTSFRQCLP